MAKKNRRDKKRPINPGDEPTRQSTELEGGQSGLEPTQENISNGDQDPRNVGTPKEVVHVEPDVIEGEIIGLDEEENPEFLVINVDEEVYDAQVAQYTDDKDVQDLLSERQRLNTGSDRLWENLREHTSQSPDTSADDIDANWERAEQVGEEAVGGSVATPDQDIVDELGEAVGLTYDDNEPLRTEEKLDARDRSRYELNPEIAEDADWDELDEEEVEVVGIDLEDLENEGTDLMDILEEDDEEDDPEDIIDDEALEEDDLDEDEAEAGLDDEDELWDVDYLEDLEEDDFEDDD